MTKLSCDRAKPGGGRGQKIMKATWYYHTIMIVPKLKQEMVGFWGRHSYAITPPYWTNEIEIPCSKDLDMEMANEYS